MLDLYKNSNNCLTVDCREINKRGPAKFRTVVGNPEEQWCYLNISSNVKQYNTYLFKIFFNKDSETDEPNFKIEKLITKTKSGEQYNFNLNKEVDRTNSNTKDDQPTSGVFRDKTSGNTRIYSQRYNRENLESSTSRLFEKHNN